MAKSSVKRNTFDHLPGTTSAVATGSKEARSVTFGPKNHAKTITFYTTFRHGRKWKKPMSKSSVKRNGFRMVFRTKSDQT